MKVFTITREGVYRHEILGIYTDLFQAMAVAYSIADHTDEDGYHAYRVSESEMNIGCEDVTPLYLYQRLGRYTGKMGGVEISRFENNEWGGCCEMSIYEVYQLCFIDGDGASFEEHRSDSVYISKAMADQKCKELLDSDLGWWDIKVVTLRVND